MSGNTSETRCKHCGGEEGHLVHHAGKGFKNAHKFEPTPPEGEAVPEQAKCEDACDAKNGIHTAMCHLRRNPAAPVVSTAAPEPPTIKVQRYDPIAEIQEIANNLAKSGDCIGSLKLEAAINVLAPDSYKPAEEVMPTATEDDNRSHIRRSAKEASLKTPGLAATPVTVEAPEPKWPALDPENGDFTDGWNQAIDLCKEAFSKWATPKPIGDVEAVARKIYEASPVINGEVRPSFDEIIRILIPFFARISDKTLNAIVQDVAELPDRTSPDDWPEAMLVTAEELKAIISGNIEESAQPPCSECATLRKERDDAKRIHRNYLNEWQMQYDAMTERAEAAEAQLSTLRDALRGMLESYDLLIEQAQSHFQSETLKGVIEGAFVGEITRARKLLAPTPEVAKEGK